MSISSIPLLIVCIVGTFIGLVEGNGGASSAYFRKLFKARFGLDAPSFIYLRHVTCWPFSDHEHLETSSHGG